MERRNPILAVMVVGALACAGAHAQSRPPAKPGEVPTGDALSQAATALRLSIEDMDRQVPSERVGAALRHARGALVETHNAIAALAAADKAAEEAAKQSRTRAHPEVASTQATLQAGCWARLHEQPGYQGRALTLAGPADVSAVTRTAAPDWQGVGSLVVGPRATLVARAKDPAGASTLTIGGGQELADVTETQPPGLFASLEQLQIRCDG